MQQMKNAKKLMMMLALSLTVVVMSCDEKLNEDMAPQEETANNGNSRLRQVGSDTFDTSGMDNWTDAAMADLPQAAQDYLTENHAGAAIEEGYRTETGEFVLLLDNGMVVIFNADGAVILEFDLDALLDDHDEDDEDWDEIPLDSLPQSILDYVTANYPNSTIEEAVVCPDNNHIIVFLDTDEALEFDADGNFVGVFDEDDWDDEEWDEIPLDSLPEAVTDYVTTNYPNSTIEEAVVCPDNNHIIVFLDSGEALEFDADGNFVGEFDEDDWDDDWEEGIDEVALDSLPQAIKDHLAANYATATAEEAWYDTVEELYYVLLDTDVFVVYDKDGNFVEELDEDDIDDEEEEIDEVDWADVPQAIKDYIAANYADNTVEGAYWDKVEELYYIELNGDLYVVFDKDGNFKEEFIDD